MSPRERPDPSRSTEHERARALRRIFAAPTSHVVLGIGDDAAILSPPEGALVWSIDAQVEGVHFRREWMSLSDIGYRATMAALSDLGAMGARPLGVLAALTLPRTISDAELAEIARGQRDAADEIGTAIVGGNMARSGELGITTTVLGSAGTPLRRDGARAGHVVWLAGHPGRAGLGLAARQRGAAQGGDLALCDLAFRRPRALVHAGIEAARAGAAAMIDVSDGLAADVGHLATESGVRVVLDAACLADPVVESAARELGVEPRAILTSGGEDYALVATAEPGVVLPGFRRVGRVEVGEGVVLSVGEAVEPLGGGFDHFD